MIKFNLKEGLNLRPKQTFETLVNKYHPESRQTTTFGYDWVFPIEAKTDLLSLDLPFEIMTVKNREHPDYRKSFILVNMYHGPDSEFKHLVKEEGDTNKLNFAVGDKVKLKQTAPLWDLLNANQQHDTYTVLTINNGLNVKLTNNKLVFNIFTKHLKKVKISSLIKEYWQRLNQISNNLNLNHF